MRSVLRSVRKRKKSVVWGRWTSSAAGSVFRPPMLMPRSSAMWVSAVLRRPGRCDGMSSGHCLTDPYPPVVLSPARVRRITSFVRSMSSGNRFSS